MQAVHETAIEQAQQQHATAIEEQAQQHECTMHVRGEEYETFIDEARDARELALKHAEEAHAGSLAMVVLQSKGQQEQLYEEQQAELALVLNERVRTLDRVESEHAMVAAQLRSEHEATVERLLEALELRRQGEEQGELMGREIRSLRAERKELIKKWSDDISMLHKLLEQEIHKRNKEADNDKLYQADNDKLSKEKLLSSRFKAFSANLGREARRHLERTRDIARVDIARGDIARGDIDEGLQVVTRSGGDSSGGVDLPRRLATKARAGQRTEGQRGMPVGAAAAAGMMDEEDPGEMCQTQ
jgi:hypothetical protein